MRQVSLPYVNMKCTAKITKILIISKYNSLMFSCNAAPWAACPLRTFLKEKVLFEQGGQSAFSTEECPNSGQPPGSAWTEKLRFSPTSVNTCMYGG